MEKKGASDRNGCIHLKIERKKQVMASGQDTSLGIVAADNCFTKSYNECLV